MNRMTTWAGSIAAVSALLGPTVPSAEAVDLTGTWTGTASCQGSAPNLPPSIGAVVHISQAAGGTDLNVRVSLETSSLDGELNGRHRYHGTLIEGSPHSTSGRVLFVECGTTSGASAPPSGAIGTARGGLDKQTNQQLFKGSLIGGDGSSALYCKLDGLQQTSTDDPHVKPCP